MSLSKVETGRLRYKSTSLEEKFGKNIPFCDSLLTLFL
jgi:hypothetical protein